MLQNIRDKTSGWIAYVIIGLISIPFALWGINSYLGGGEQQPAAIVDGTEISSQQLDYAYARYRDRLSAIFGGTLPAAFDDEVTLKEQVLTQIIEEQVLRAYVQDKGFRVGDQKLFENIQGMAVFQQDGRFDKDQYIAQLASQGYQPATFEQELRSSSEMQQLNQAISATAFLSPTQIQIYNDLKNQQRKLRLITVENRGEALTVSDQEIEAYYNEQDGRYMDSAMVKVDYIELGIDHIMQSIELSEDDLRQRYDQLADQLTTPQIRTASHILITVNNNAEDDEDAEAKKTILDLKSRIDQGEDFSGLAREFSQDPGSAEEGGDLGEVERGMMVKSFESALFDLQPDEVSEPVKTQFGWHLIKLHEITGGTTQAFEEARSTIEGELKTERAEIQIYDLVESLSNIGYEQPDSILPASEQLGLEIQTTDWFSRSLGAGLANQDKFRQVAFSDEVLKNNRNSEVIELSDNRVVLMHLNSHKPATKKPLESVRESIIETIKRNKGREQALEKGQELLAQLRQGAKLGELADKEAISIVDPGFVSRNSTAIDPQVLSTAFTMQKPDAGSEAYEGVTEVDGDYSIIEFTDVNVSSEKDPESTEEETVEALTVASADYEFQALVKLLTEQADIIRTPVTELQ
jgi:peptidyl-prolyl cis-trans isomerase D